MWPLLYANPLLAAGIDRNRLGAQSMGQAGASLANDLDAVTSAAQNPAALDWNDSFVYRAGLEYDLTPSLVMRPGYVYGNSPVPSQTLLPTTAAITEHTIAIGLGCKLQRCRIDFAYPYDLPASQKASATAIRDSEHKNSRVEVQAHWLGITTTVPF